MSYEYQPSDLAEITREAHRMRNQAIAESITFVWRGGKGLVVALATHTAELGHMVAAYIGQRLRHH